MELRILPEAPESRSTPGPPVGAGSALHLCPRGSHTAPSWPVCGMWTARQGEQGGKKKKKDLAGGQSSRSSYRCCYLHYFHIWKNKEQEAANNSQELSVCRAQPIRGLEQTGYHFTDTEHLYSDEGSASSLCVEAGGGRTSGPSTCHCSQTSTGDQRREPRLRLSLDAPDGDRLMASALIPAFELLMRGAGSPVVLCDAPLVRAAYCSL